MVFILCQGAIFAQEDDEVLQVEPGFEELFLMPYISEIDMEHPVSDDPLAAMIIQGVQSGEYKGAYQKLYKIAFYAEDSLVSYNFVSKLGNYATDLYLFYKDSNNQVVKKIFRYNDKTNIDAGWIKEARLRLPTIYQDFELYVLGDYNSWTINHWYLTSDIGYSKYINAMSQQATAYLVLVSIFLLFALVGYFILKNKIIGYYAFYLFATSLYIFKELNTLPLEFLYDFPVALNFLNESILSIFLLSVIYYTRSICDPEKSYAFEPIFFKVLVGLTLISFFIMSFVMNNIWSLVLSYLVNYGVNAYIIMQLIRNFKNNIALRFFFAGIMIILVLGILMDLQLHGLIDFPSVFYWTIPALILELLLIGIGIIFGLKLRSNELQEAIITNTNLNESVISLEKKVNHSKGAYQTLIANNGNGALNLPQEYLDDPLTQREMEVIQLLNKGYTNQKLADEMFISRNTIKTHLKNIYKKLDVSDREEALEKMRSYGIM